MRSRCMCVLLVLLLFALSACSSKPADTSASSTSGPAAGSNTAGGSAVDSKTSTKTGEKPTPSVSTVVLPAGTTLTVRLSESLGSKLSTSGQSFSATLAEPLVVNGNTVIPAGASARGTVVDAKPLGKFKGGAVLAVELTSIAVGGSDKTIETSAVSHSIKGKGKRTAVVTGGGAAVGALIGGLAGGGKGAAIGAAAGAGAGATGAAFTGNQEIVLPAESALTFKLKQPLELKPSS